MSKTKYICILNQKNQQKMKNVLFLLMVQFASCQSSIEPISCSELNTYTIEVTSETYLTVSIFDSTGTVKPLRSFELSPFKVQSIEMPANKLSFIGFMYEGSHVFYGVNEKPCSVLRFNK